MEFKILTSDDYEMYQSYKRLVHYKNYHTNFHSLYIWNNEFKCRYYRDEKFLIVKFTYDGLEYFNLPLCKEENLKEAVQWIIDYCERNNLPLMLNGIAKEEEALLNELFPNKFVFVHNSGYDSYIYEAEPNRTLSGKKMNSRRNHFNAFMREYGERAVFRKCRPEDKPEVQALLKKWAEGKADDFLVEAERKGIMSVMDNLDHLDLTMCCVEIDGVIKAFTIASMIDDTTLQVHVEKADHSIRGLYVAIFKWLLEYEYPEVQLVNREEDLGIEYLRKAKQQLHPIEWQQISWAYLDKVEIRAAVAEDKEALKKLWLGCFKEDTEEFYEEYYDKLDKKIYVLTVDNRIVSTMYLRKVELSDGGQADFIEGVSTHPLYRGAGYMKRLLGNVLSDEGNYFLQAYNWDVYKSFGFKEAVHKKLITLTEKLPTTYSAEIIKGFNESKFLELYDSFARNLGVYPKRSEGMFRLMANEAIYNNDAYCLYSRFGEKEDKTVILELCYRDKTAAFSLINEIIECYGAVSTVKILSECDFLPEHEGENKLFLKMRGRDNFKVDYFNDFI